MSNTSEWYNLNWHDDQPFVGIIERTVPSSKFKKAIQDRLLEIWVAEHYDFKVYKDKDVSTLYDNQIYEWKQRKASVELELKKEEETFKKLFEKFQAQNHVEVQPQATGDTTEEDEEENGSDTVMETKETVSHKVCKQSRRTIAKNIKHEIMLAKSIKSSMASSQQTLVDLQKEQDELDEKISSYEAYQAAAQYSIREMKKIALEYEKTKDRDALVKKLDSLLSYRDKMMRRNISPNPCSGEKGLCKTHHLYLTPTRYTKDGVAEEAKCYMSP